MSCELDLIWRAVEWLRNVFDMHSLRLGNCVDYIHLDKDRTVLEIPPKPTIGESAVASSAEILVLVLLCQSAGMVPWNIVERVVETVLATSPPGLVGQENKTKY